MGKAKVTKEAKQLATKVVKETKPVKEAKPAKVVVEKLSQNGVTCPSEGTKTREIWDISDQISQELGEPAGRKEVIAECLKRDINESTGATQYARWRKFHGIKAPVSTARPVIPVEDVEAEETEEAAGEADEVEEVESEEVEETEEV